jgi:hypothetical protein
MALAEGLQRERLYRSMKAQRLAWTFPGHHLGLPA